MAICKISLNQIVQYINFIGQESTVIDPLVKVDSIFKEQVKKLIEHFENQFSE